MAGGERRFELRLDGRELAPDVACWTESREGCERGLFVRDGEEAVVGGSGVQFGVDFEGEAREKGGRGSVSVVERKREERERRGEREVCEGGVQ
jgi:hypothetical protein